MYKKNMEKDRQINYILNIIMSHFRGKIIHASIKYLYISTYDVRFICWSNKVKLEVWQTVS